ncbi:hypothetical protein ANN_26576 [Periplaneta americana]|uniref:PiggyBac transposable element-derived protein domain-containing protein n=1 Tax=Periplaneta americana TaxID=6978 RepID=A0ABQ8RYG0_PERAM|nr:hypothetical protein ANN_26576 [Periplaneta americana]
MQYDEGSELLICRWNDNSVVTVVSNCDSVLPVLVCKTHRFSTVSQMEDMDLLSFRRSIAMGYQRQYGTPKSRPSLSAE